MLKPSYINILLGILVKYILAIIVIMIAANNYTTLRTIGSISNLTDLVYVSILVLSIPFLEAVVFSAPLFLAFKIRNLILFSIIILLITVGEYFFYIYRTSHKHISQEGVILGLVGLLVLGVFFFKNSGLKRIKYVR